MFEAQTPIEFAWTLKGCGTDEERTAHFPFMLRLVRTATSLAAAMQIPVKIAFFS
jgi:hypothetical protein